MTQDYRLIISKFLEWLSGFTDADGFFNLSKKKDNTFIFRFGINLRDDDAPVLQTIKDTLGFGTISRKLRRRNLVNTAGQSYATNPQVEFSVCSIKDCLKVVDIFSNHPLRSKKREVFEVWSKAVKEYAKGSHKNKRLLELYCIEMHELKKYQGRPESIASEIEHFLQENRQAKLFEREEC